MESLILHLFGDYISQSDWMANRKTTSSWAAFCHALTYSLPFLLLGSWLAVLVIFVTHFFIDRFRLARYVVWLKNFLSPPPLSLESVMTPDEILKLTEEQLVAAVAVQKANTWWHPWSECSGTGYHKDKPAWLAVWLMIVADNTLHLAFNWAALRWL